MHRALAWGAVAAQLLFTASWFFGGLAEGRGYRSSAHDISDLGAPIAGHPRLVLTAQGVAGALTVAFALFVLQRRDGAGYAERGLALAASTGVVLLAVRTLGILAPLPDAAVPSVGWELSEPVGTLDSAGCPKVSGVH